MREQWYAANTHMRDQWYAAIWESSDMQPTLIIWKLEVYLHWLTECWKEFIIEKMRENIYFLVRPQNWEKICSFVLGLFLAFIRYLALPVIRFSLNIKLRSGLNPWKWTAKTCEGTVPTKKIRGTEEQPTYIYIYIYFVLLPFLQELEWIYMVLLLILCAGVKPHISSNF